MEGSAYLRELLGLGELVTCWLGPACDVLHLAYSVVPSLPLLLPPPLPSLLPSSAHLLKKSK